MSEPLSDKRVAEIIARPHHTHECAACSIACVEFVAMAREIQERRAADPPKVAAYFDGIPAKMYDVVCPYRDGDRLATAHYVVVDIDGTRLRFAHEDGDFWWESKNYRLHMRGPRHLTLEDCMTVRNVFSETDTGNLTDMATALRAVGIEVEG